MADYLFSNARARNIKLSQMRRIVVLRALFLGDMLCAVPALRALRRAVPDAHIVLCGLSWAQEFVERFSQYINALAALPRFDELPEPPIDRERVDHWSHSLRRQRFDLAIQLHGSGPQSNAVCALFAAKRLAGYYVPGQDCPDRSTFLPYPSSGAEIQRNLRLVEFLGAPSAGDHLEFPVWAADEHHLAELTRLPDSYRSRYVCVHAGAKLATRRWPAERFAEVANALGERGQFVILTGNDTEHALVQ